MYVLVSFLIKKSCNLWNIVRQDLIQLNEKLHQQSEFANNLLLQCGIDSSYALTQVNRKQKLIFN